jgi:hypothetical protein
MNDTLNIKSGKATLKRIFEEPLESVISRETKTFDNLAAPFENSVVLFGAGGLGKKTLAGLRSIGIEPLGFADNNPALWGKDVSGIPVFSLQDAVHRFGQDAAFVITIWKGEAADTMKEREQQLLDLNCSRVIPFSYLYWKYGEIFAPHYAFDMPHKVFEQSESVIDAFSLWSDDASRGEYLAQIRWRTFMDFDSLPHPVTHEIYFPTDLLTILPDEVFVDCGAYDGDTIRNLLHTQSPYNGSIIAFEPDPSNFIQLEKYAQNAPAGIRSKLNVYPYAVGSERSMVRFEASGTEASAVGSGD